jgi:hypothetical protein
MSSRDCIKVLALTCLVLSFTGCTNMQVGSIVITPAAQTVTVGQTVQLTATGTIDHGSHPATSQDVTSLVTWSSNTPTVATVSATGAVTGKSAGSATISATLPGATGSTAALTVTSAIGGNAGGELLSINIVPGGITVSNKGMTGQFLAFGTFSVTPTVRDLTNVVTWISTSPEVASIDSGGVSGEIGGLATAMGYTGNSILYAEGTNADGTVVLSNPETFTCRDATANTCIQTPATPQFATLTVFNAGENNTTWLVTAPSDTGVANLIHCGPGWTAGASVCTGTYETGSTVVLTESPTGTGFGGWSSGDGAPGVGCQPAAGTTLLNSPTCTVTLVGDTSVGAIFY